MAVEVMIMSGVEDGRSLSLSDGSGQVSGAGWALTIGRRDESDVCLRNDSFVSRDHAVLRQVGNQWFLEDCGSKNGTFLETAEADQRVTSPVLIEPGRLFRIGRTWLRLQAIE